MWGPQGTCRTWLAQMRDLKAKAVIAGIDQSVSSASNLCLTALAARISTPESFGAFAVAMSIYAIGLAAVRAIVVEPFAVRVSASMPITRHILPTASTVGIVGALAASALWVAMPAGGATLGVLAVAFIALAVNEALRGCLVAAGEPLRALVMDAVWLGVTVMTVLALRPDSILTLFGAWVAGSLLGTGAGLAALRRLMLEQERFGMRPRYALEWFRSYRELWPSFLFEQVVLIGTGYALIAALGVTSGLAEAGFYRGAQVALAPVSFVYSSALIFQVARISRGEVAGPLSSTTRRLSAGLMLCAVVLGAPVVFGPAWMGELILGEVWVGAQPVAQPLLLASVAAGAVTGSIVGLRVAVATRSSRRLRLLSALCQLGLGVGLGIKFGAVGAAWGIAVSGAGVAVAWRIELRRVLRTQERRPEEERVPKGPPQDCWRGLV